MGRFIVKAEGWYFEWSTVSDSPITRGMRLPEFEQYYRNEHGRIGMDGLPARMQRVELKGTSQIDADDAEDTVRFNRAGFNETELTLPEIVKIYCVEQRGPREGEGRERPNEAE